MPALSIGCVLTACNKLANPLRVRARWPEHRGVPVGDPRTREQGEQDLARMQAWDNGGDNLWTVSLAPWLATHVAAGGTPVGK